MRTLLFFLAVLVTIVTADDIVASSCDDCPPGPPGDKGERGRMGREGEPGDKGDPGGLYYRGTTSECGPGPCPRGRPGDDGDVGIVGELGPDGEPGLIGDRGKDGDPGVPGPPGPPGSLNVDIMYLPYKPGDDVGQVCYSFRKSCLVPGLRNGWRGWYREGQSGYMIYNKWMYFVTLSDCPCKYEKPSPPQPAKPSDCLRRGECE